jgi:hypothetical protein
LPVALFQELFVNGLNRFPVQVQMVGHLGNCHHLAKLINIICQPSGDPDIGVKQLQILDADFVTYRAKQLSVLAFEPNFSACQIQVTDATFSPAMSTVGFMPASVTNWFKAFVRLYLNPSLGGITINALIDNFYSTKGKVRCYSEFGHRRPPFGYCFSWSINI